MKNTDLYLEMEELLECDMKTGKIKVDKQIFDDFAPNTYINIQFVDTDSEEAMAFTMIAEDDEGIYMEYLGETEEYTPSVENGDYSPSNPWDAPGMSMSDFI